MVRKQKPHSNNMLLKSHEIDLGSRNFDKNIDQLFENYNLKKTEKPAQLDKSKERKPRQTKKKEQKKYIEGLDLTVNMDNIMHGFERTLGAQTRDQRVDLNNTFKDFNQMMDNQVVDMNMTMTPKL